MDLRFIERDGKRILQQLRKIPVDGFFTRTEWQDVPFVDDRIQAEQKAGAAIGGSGALRGANALSAKPGEGLTTLRAASDLVVERDTLEAERDALRALLNDAEARCRRLEADHDAPQQSAEDRVIAPIIERLEKLVAREWDKLEAERDELQATVESHRDITHHWSLRCKRLEEKLKGKEKHAEYWRKECRALRDAVWAQDAHTAAEVFAAVIRMRAEL